MNKLLTYLLLLTVGIASFSGCKEKQVAFSEEQVSQSAKGALFIIGGGSRPDAMIDSLVKFSQVAKGYGVILPMASVEPDSAFYYANLQFESRGIKMVNFNLDSTEIKRTKLDSLENASLIYMSGGDQRKLMDALNEKARKVIQKAYQKGAVISGTSAGAAVMSSKMITGDEKKHPDYTPTFKTIETENTIYDKGLGLLPNHIIIDQHFIYRSRYNRLLTSILENEHSVGIGIDESTAIYVQHDSATVVGEWQVVSFQHEEEVIRQNGKMGAKNVMLNIYLPGEKFKLPE